MCAIVGVGPGIGAANAHRFAKAGYALALVSRSLGFINELADKLEVAKAYACCSLHFNFLVRFLQNKFNFELLA